MENNFEKIISDQLRSLPPKLGEAIARVPWKEELQNIAGEKALSREQQNFLLAETLIVLAGLDTAENFEENLFTNLGGGEELAEAVIEEISNKIFTKIEGQYELIGATTPHVDEAALPSHTGQTVEPETTPLSKKLPVVKETEPVPMVVPKKETTYQSTINKLFVRPTTPAPDAPKETLTPNPSVLSEPKLELKPKIEEKMPEAPQISYPSNKDPYREPLE